MVAPVISDLPVAPSRADAPVDFTAKADALMAALQPMVTQINTSTGFVDTTAATVDSDKVAAAASAAASAASAVDSSGFADASGASAVASAASAADSLASADESALSEANSAASAAASEASSVSSAGSAAAADGSAVAAAASAVEAENWANLAEETVVGDVIADTSISSFQVRSSLNDSIGNFENVTVTANTTITALQFAQITATGGSVTVTVPATPIDGQMVMIANLTDRLDHEVDVGAAMVKGQDPSGVFLIDRAFVTITLKYINSAYGWEVMQ